MNALPAAAQIEIWNQRLAAIADTMGIVLRRSALSPNIRERADFSCAIFDDRGRLVAEAPHIPVHLGSMGRAVREVMARVPLAAGVVAITNDPYAGGTHLPDLTLVEAVYADGALIAHVACRAHHADVGGTSPGSMPVGAHAVADVVPEVAELPPAMGPRYDEAPDAGVAYRALTIADEGILISPSLLDDRMSAIANASRMPAERHADLSAQRAALATGRDALIALKRTHGDLTAAFASLLAYGERAMVGALHALTPGTYPFADSLDDDGAGKRDLALRVVLTIEGDRAIVDLTESDEQTDGSLNAVRAVTEAAIAYAFRLLLPAESPTSEGLLAPIEIRTEPGSLCDAQPPHAVAAGNVETSQRIVDLMLGAIARACPNRIPAASAGSMSSLLLGDDHHAYYETIAGGAGAGPTRDGAHATQTHMTNTRNTPVEILESTVPVRVRTYAIRRGSGGGGTHRGGDGIVRELELLAPMTVTLVGDRRRRPPYGLSGGGPGLPGLDMLTRGDETRQLPAKIVMEGKTGDRLRIETPGGGGYGDSRRAKFWESILSGAPLTREDLA